GNGGNGKRSGQPAQPPPSPLPPGSGASGAATVTVVTANDPNGLGGPGGFGGPAWLPSGQPITYSAFFENEPTASASAAQVIVTDHLDPLTLDLTSVNLGAISFAGQTVTPTIENSPPAGLRQFNAN